MEELYRSLYAKYAAGLSSEDMDAKVQYALQQDPNQFIDSFYKKYTGSGPSEDQIGYMNSYLENKPATDRERVDALDLEDRDSNWFTKTWNDWFGDHGKVIKTRNDVLYDLDGNFSKEQLENFVKGTKLQGDKPIYEFTKDFNNYVETERGKLGDEDLRLWDDIKIGLNAATKYPLQTGLVLWESLIKNPVALYTGDSKMLGINTAIAGSWASRKKSGWGKLGSYGSSMYAMSQGQVDAAFALDELITEELGQGYTAEDLKGLFEDEEKFDQIRRSAIAKGGTTAMIDKLGMTITSKIGAPVNKGIQRITGNKVVGSLGASGARVFSEGLSGAGAEGAGQYVQHRSMGMDHDEAIKNLDGVELAMEFFAEMGPGGVSSIADLYQASKNSQYLLNGNSHSLADFIHLTDNMTDEELAQVTFNVTNNDAIKNPLEARRSDGIIKNNLDTRVTEQSDRNKLFTLEKELTELESTPEANRSQSKKNQIADKKKEIKDITNTYFEQNQGLQQAKEKTGEAVTKQVFGADTAEAMGGKTNILTRAEMKEKFGEEASESNGFQDEQTGEIFINKDVALSPNGNLNVTAHEFIHKALRNRLKKNFEGTNQTIQNFLNDLDSDTRTKLDERILAVDKNGERLYSDEYLASSPDEYLAQLSDLMLENKVKLKKDIKLATKFKLALENFVNKILGRPEKDLKFETTNDVIAFMEANTKAFRTGKADERLRRFTGKTIATTGPRKFSKVTIPDGNPKEYVDSLTKGATTKAEFQSPDGGFGQVYEGIINGDFDKLLTGFSTAQKNLAREELANRLINYDPALTPSLYKWFGSNIVYAKREANKALVETKAKPKSIDRARKTAEGDTKYTQIEDTQQETAEDILDKKLEKKAPKKEKPTLRRKVGFERNGTAHNKIKAAIKRNILRNIVITRKALKADIATGVYKKGDTITETLDITDLRWQKEIAKALGLDLQSLMMESMGRSSQEFEAFLDQHIEEAFNMMDQNLINNRFDDLVYKIKDRQGSVESALDKKVKNKTAGNALFGKKDMSKEDLIKYFLKRGRKNSLAQVLGTEFAFDALIEVLLEGTEFDADGNITKKGDFLTKAEELLVSKHGLEGDALIALIAKQVNRDPGMKFSKVLNVDQKQEYLQNADNVVHYLKRAGLPVTRKNLITVLEQLFPEWSPNTINSFATELYRPARKYFKPENKKFIKDVDFGVFSLEGINLDINKANINVEKLYGIKKAMSWFFNHKKYRQRQRQLNKDYFVQRFENAKTKKEKIAVIKALLLHKSHNTGAGTKLESTIKRYQVYQGVDDFVNATFGQIPGVEVRGNKVFFDGQEIKNTQPQQNANKVTKEGFENTYAERQEKANEAWEEVNNYLKWIHNNGDVEIVAMSMMTLKSHMGSMLKSAAPAEFYFVGKYKGELKYEHMLPTQWVAMALAQHYTGIKKYNLKDLQSKYKVAIIPKSMDDNFNLQYRQDRLSNFDPSTDGIDALYYNAATWGFPNMFQMQSLDGKGQPIGVIRNPKNEVVNQKELKRLVNRDKIIRKFSKVNPEPEKGMSVLDFDDTLAITDSKVIVNLKDGNVVKWTPAEFAKNSETLVDEIESFDFSEFNEVKKGKKGPFFKKALDLQKKYGSKDIYILTARPQIAAPAIQKFLKGVGLNIPLKNIIGLEDGTSQAKADWIADKVANQGFNNVLFADDQLANTKAVKEVLELADVKNKVVQAERKFSKTLDQNFNEILEQESGVNKDTTYSDAAAKAQGANKQRYRFFIPPSAEDFMGLMYNFLAKGKAGDISMRWIKQALIDPYWAGVRSLNIAKQQLANDFRELKTRFPKAFKSLTKEIGYQGFTYEQAIRAYLFNKAGYEVPGLNEKDTQALVNLVKSKPNVRQFADLVGATTKLPEGYSKPTDNWVTGSIALDFFNIAQKVNRKRFLATWIERKNEIFSDKNLNKIEAIYGSSFREALEDILWRMENGTNRTTGRNKLVNSWLNWVNNSVGAIMFLNSRSAVLQTISMINFINWSDNNPLKAGAAFLNQKQFWADFVMIFNSDMLKQRRAGLQTDVNEAEIAQAVAGKTDKVSAAIAYLLRKGFLPTQMADSFAISMGGASFFRNRFNSYKKQGMSDVEAKEKAFADFQETSEVSQQSADPALISGQQASPLGRLILAFQNTPMQYARLMKKAALDLKNGRGDVKTNISKLVYYGAIQNLIFSTMQSALFAMAFEDDEEFIENKKHRALNTSLDSLLRGMGVYGAAVSTVKNMILQFNKQEKKGWSADHAYTLIEAINLSPPIGSKARKVYSATQTWKFNREVIPHMGMDIDNPAFLAIANIVSAGTNIPLDRVVMKLNNLRAASNKENEAWQRVATFLGWNTWDVGIENEGRERAKEELKKLKKKNKSRSSNSRKPKKRK